ncbi:MAG: rhomboid family intramembrane serine protease [Solirubrobacterales bacterium]
MEASSQTCYRHPGRETNVSCSNCGRSICTDCMTPSPVGMRCPECASERQRVYTRADISGGPVGGIAGYFRESPVTSTLILINVLVFLAQIATGYPLGLFSSNGGGWVTQHGLLYAPLVAQGEWWRVITPGFLHLGLLHIAMNMYLLYVLGRMLEPELGSIQMLAVYVTSLLAGSLGAIILEPGTPSAGASGAIFGLMGMALVIARSRGISDAVKQIGVLVVLNLVITFGYSGISKGAHLGGLIGGMICGLILFELGERRGWLGRGARARYVGTAIVTVMGFALFFACVIAARAKYPGLA